MIRATLLSLTQHNTTTPIALNSGIRAYYTSGRFGWGTATLIPKTGQYFDLTEKNTVIVIQGEWEFVLLGVVVTSYQHPIYRVDKVDIEQDPIFEVDIEQVMTFKEYFRSKYRNT